MEVRLLHSSKAMHPGCVGWLGYLPTSNHHLNLARQHRPPPFLTAHFGFVKLITSLLCSSKNVAHTDEQFIFMIINLGKQAKAECRISIRCGSACN